MKTQILALFGSLVLPLGSEAATIAIGSGFGPLNGVIPQTIGGVSLAAGGYYIGVGTFDSIPTIQEIASSFKEFGYATSPSSAGPTQGKIVASITSNPANPSDFNTKELFIVVGNGPTRAASTDFAILRGTDPTFYFPADTAAAGATTITLASTENFEPLPGAGKEIDNPTGVDRIEFPGLIPEPSSALLATVASLIGLVRRRRSPRRITAA